MNLLEVIYTYGAAAIVLSGMFAWGVIVGQSLKLYEHLARASGRRYFWWRERRRRTPEPNDLPWSSCPTADDLREHAKQLARGALWHGKVNAVTIISEFDSDSISHAAVGHAGELIHLTGWKMADLVQRMQAGDEGHPVDGDGNLRVN